MSKKRGIKFYFTLLTTVLNLAALVLYAVSVSVTVSQEVNVSLNIRCMALLVLGILGNVFTLAVSGKREYRPWMDYTFLFIAVFLAFALMLCLKDRIYSIAVLLGSELYSTDIQAYTQLYEAIGAMGVMLAAVITNCAGGFMTFQKQKEGECEA